MSQHEIVNEKGRWVFGWDQPLMSFFLQLHKTDVTENSLEVNPILWLGATGDTAMYEVEDLVRVAKKHGLEIGYPMQVTLYGERDDGR